MESDQIRIVAAAVFCDPEQVFNAFETRFAGKIIGDVSDCGRLNRFYNYVTFLHPIPSAHPYVGMLPDANAASDCPLPNSLSKSFSKYHNLLDRRSGAHALCNAASILTDDEHEIVISPRWGLVIRDPRSPRALPRAITSRPFRAENRCGLDARKRRQWAVGSGKRRRRKWGLA